MSQKVKQLGFEEALQSLEKVVRSLELGEVPLERALELFQEGIALVRTCSSKLDEAEKKIQLLQEGAAGQIILQPAVSLGEF